MATDKFVSVPPEQILVDDNIRFGLIAADVSSLKQSILDNNGVLVPVEVEPLGKDAPNGFKYRLTTGFKRHQAVSELNSEAGAGLELPAIVRAISDPTTRLMHQVSENVDRKSLSPMDQATTIQKLLDAGVSKLKIRELFRVVRPGAKKDQAVKPASNAWLNMTLSFLSLPRSIQTKIHEGRVGVAAAYELTKVPAERQVEIIEKAEAEIAASIEKEEKEEEKYLASTKKLEDATKEVETSTSARDTAKAELELSQKALEVAEDSQAAAFKALKQAEKGKDKDAKKKAKEAFTALEADVKGLQKKVVEQTKLVTKADESATKAAAKTEELRKKLEEARKPKAAKTAVGSKDVKQAAKAAGVAGAGHVALTLAQIRKTVEELALPGTYPKVAAIGAAMVECFNGVTTPGMMLKKLAAITGELEAKPAKPAKK